MAKKFPKSKNKKVSAIAKKKTREHLFDIMYSAYEELGEIIVRPEMDNMSGEMLEALSLSLIALRIAVTRDCQIKTPRVSTGRKGRPCRDAK